MYVIIMFLSSFFPASKGEKGEMVGKTRGKRVFL